jgi:hypothetical protein
LCENNISLWILWAGDALGAKPSGKTSLWEDFPQEGHAFPTIEELTVDQMINGYQIMLSQREGHPSTMGEGDKLPIFLGVLQLSHIFQYFPLCLPSKSLGFPDFPIFPRGFPTFFPCGFTLSPEGMTWHLDPESALFAELRQLLPQQGIDFELMEIGGAGRAVLL